MIKREDKLEQKSAAKPESVTVELSDSELDRVAGGISPSRSARMSLRAICF